MSPKPGPFDDDRPNGGIIAALAANCLDSFNPALDDMTCAEDIIAFLREYGWGPLDRSQQ